MQITNVLQRKDGATVALGVLLALVLNGTVVPVAEYFSKTVLQTGAGSFIDGVVAPLVTLVVAVLLVEAFLRAVDRK